MMTVLRTQRIGLDSPMAAQWDAFIAESPTGTVYHSTPWLAALAEGMGQNIKIHFVTASDRIEAGVVLRASRRYGFTFGHKPWATAYNGLVTSRAPHPDACRVLLESLADHYRYARLVHPPAAAQPPLSSRWRKAANSTGLLKISDTDTLWRSFDRHARQRVRKAADKGIIVTQIDFFDDFYDLYRMTYLRQQLPMPLSRGEVTATLLRASRAGAVTCFGAFTDKQEPAAMLVVGQDNKRAYFMLAGSHPLLRKTDAVSLLWWNVMLACARTHSEIDLIGMGIDSIARFKNSWSPQVTPFYETTFDSSGLTRAVLKFARRIKERKGRLLR